MRLRPDCLAVALALLLLGGACASPEAKTPPTTGKPKTLNGGTITSVGNADPVNLNPKSTKSVNSSLLAPLWRGVWRTTPDFRFELDTDLVTSAEMTSADPQTIVYRVNPKAAWSDGVPVDADDFIYNWQLTRPGAVDVDGSPIQMLGDSVADSIASVTGSDGGKTVTVVYRQPNSEWKAGRVFNILLPAHVARRVGFNAGFDHFDPSILVSDAPFRLGGYNPGQDMTFVRNERYWGEPASLDRVVFRFTTLDAAAGALRNGEGDLANGQDALPDNVALLESTPGIAATVFPSLAQETLFPNQHNPLLAIGEVRQAIALALDRKGVCSRVFTTRSAPDVVNSFVWANNQPAYRDTSQGRYDRPDVAGAKRALESAGFALGGDGVYAKDGKRLAFRLLTINAAPRSQEAQLIQAQLKAVGIEVQVDGRSLALFAQASNGGDFDLRVGSYVKTQFGTINLNLENGVVANLGYTNPRPQDLMQQAHAELVEATRLDLIDQADRILWSDLPMLPLCQRPLLFAVRDTFVNIAPNVTAGAYWNIERWARKA